jgi:probable HAF family extracellular repeat protein
VSKNAFSTLTSLLLSSALSATALAAPTRPNPDRQASLPHYVLFDVGSFGGHFSGLCGPSCRIINSHNVVVGIDATSLADPFAPNCFADCHVDHAFQWKHGGTSDLGSLQYGVSSFGVGINEEGVTAGISQNGKIDEKTTLFEARAVVWGQGGRIKNLGTLGGTQSAGGPVNISGQVVVQSSTSDSNDPYVGVPQANCIWLPTTQRNCSGLDFGTNSLFLPVTTSTHGAVWSRQSGLKDAGTLGGPDSTLLDINDSGQAVGWSYTSSQAGASGVPDTHPFLWDKGTATDLGTLGGTFGEATLINVNGQVTGTSNLAGDTELRPFIWDKVNGMVDLGNLGGDYGHSDWINDQGDVVGFSRTTPGSIAGHAFYWHAGVIADLGVIGGDPESEAEAINNKGIIVGVDFDRNIGDLRGWASVRGGPMIDLNTLIRKPYGLYITAASGINDRGVIAANAVTRKGESHAVVLVPENGLDILAHMQVIARDTPHQDDSLPGVAPSRNGYAPQPNCAAEPRMRPAVCHRG